ncbi:MAG: transposase [Blautia sp.]|nr:transposase [Blautia sp.]
MLDRPFDYIGAMQCENKILRKKVAEYESGERYQRIKEDHKKVLEEYRRQIERQKHELEDLRRQIKKIWSWCEEAYADALKEFEKKLDEMERALKAEQVLRIAAEQAHDAQKDANRMLRHELYEVKTALEDEKGKTKKLLAQLNRDYENSSIPSSRSVHHKKISNNRERSGRKPGAQPGHVHHGRKKQTPTQIVLLPPPDGILHDPDFRKTKKEIVKQLVKIRLVLDVTEYHANVYYNSKTGERVHAAFPAGVINDVNYDGSVKALLFLLNTDCAASIDKSRRLLSDLTGGKLNISKGMINKLCREFASKTEDDRKKVFVDLLSAPVMHTDCTNARVNGKSAYVFVCFDPGEQQTLYFAREKKGHEGVKETVVQDYQGILVHDHESTFYHYGTRHQECLAHVQRYLKNSMENEPSLTWNKEMRSLLQRMIHYRNEHADEVSLDLDVVTGFESEYHAILEKAREEYEYEPPGDYYRDGYNLYRRMQKKEAEHLLFLHDLRVPTTNNTAERCLRDVKRKQTFVMAFRSFESLDYLCQSKSVLLGVRKNNLNVYDAVVNIFNT